MLSSRYIIQFRFLMANSMLGLTNIFELQKLQQQHDLKYHQDVLFLNTADRIKHLVLHFVKYLGKLESQRENEIILCDMFICCLSMANLLNVNLSNDIKIPTYSQGDLIIFIGKMAKAAEALDHVESYPSHRVLVEELNNLASVTHNMLIEKKLDIYNLIYKRWTEVEMKNIFYNSSQENTPFFKKNKR